MAETVPISEVTTREDVGVDPDTRLRRSRGQERPATDEHAQTEPQPAAPAEPRAGAMGPTMARMHAEAAVGQVVMALSVLPRYRHLPLSEIDTLVLQPLMRNRLVIAAAAPTEEKPPEGNRDENPATGPGNGQTAGFAIWASVSEDADSRIREQIAAGVFPVRLRPEDWTGGSINWLLDVVAPDVRTVSAILANFRKLAGGGDLRLHPLISRLVPRETLEKMGASRMASPGGSSEAERPEQASSPDA